MDKKYIDISENIIEENKELIPAPSASSDGSDEPKDINYWRSFRELYNDPSFRKEKSMEFHPGELDKPDLNTFSKFSRRKFLALLSASAAVAASGCSNYRDKGELIPYNKKPESVTVGNPTYYASTCTGCSSACGILIKTLDGRPVKVDGNPDHPVSKGKICAIGQASVMSLYDPERLKNPVERVNRVSPNNMDWKTADEKIIAELKSAAASGKEISVITHTVNSPSLKKLFDEFAKAYPTAKVYSYELFEDTPRNSAWEKCYGSKNYPLISWDKANIILSLESDFLGNEGNKVETSRLYTSGRDAINGKEFNRLYSVEGNASVTGMNSDYRLILKTDAIEEFVMCLLNELAGKEKISSYSSDAGIMSKLQSFNLKSFAEKYNLSEEVINHLVSDLKKNQGASYVSAGSMLPESTHIAVNMLNEVLGNSALYKKEVSNVKVMPLSTREELENLVSDLNSGKTTVVIHYDSNPVYHLPPDLGYADAVKKAKTIVSLSESDNESSNAGNYVLPVNSMFESWGDYQTRNNFFSLQQPVIAPIYNNRQKEDILMTWISGNPDSYNSDSYHKFVMDNWKANILSSAGTDSDFNRAWYAGLNDGVVMVSKKEAAAQEGENVPAPEVFNPASFVSNTSSMRSKDGFSLLLIKSGALGDGRHANNGWLQELPKPVSRIVWDNYAAISVQSAKALGVDSNDNISITTQSGKMDIPVFVQPGMADGVLAIELGYGRTVCGTVGLDAGFNANVLMTKNPALSRWFYNDVKAEKSSGKYELVSVQDQYPMDEPLYKDIQYRREIIQEGTYLQFKENPDFLHDRHTKYSEEETFKLKVGSINEQYKHTGTKWGMVIDLNKCIGCNECVAACSVENNIPVVGKEQAKKHRSMQWIRIDRYYSGTPETPKASFQPMLCQHCDFAPCENVCPVAATTHSADGINGMAYNRCVGTRYCSNNCPYKVRRFNYFNFRDHFKDGIQLEESFTLMQNPEVTVRSRGVMEKCTFCLQRIMDERQMAIQENRQVKGSNVKTACQEACNTNAISFGDQNDKESDIFKLNNSKLAYHVLEEIKVKPNVTYLAKLRNVYEIEKEEAHH
ncbi:MAG: TAT-variant-translocated molybdopterin oxidoreductase [Bacteroidetes bacterium]|nr:TAT-variant-translocated molybdopterin oxidoreductase [Bacteroidota bacterium]